MRFDPETDRQLIAWAQGADPKRAAWGKARMCERHAGLVNAYAYRAFRGNYETADVIAEGNIGLLHAVQRFDPSRGVKFSSYAVPWIRCFIFRLTTPMSSRSKDTFWKLLRLRRATDVELSQEQCAEALGVPVESVAACDRATSHPLNIDGPLPGTDLKLGDVVADDEAVDALEALKQASEAAMVRRAVARLPKRLRRIVAARFGLDDGEERTLIDIGGDLGVCRERVRQLQVDAFALLSASLEKEMAA